MMIVERVIFKLINYYIVIKFSKNLLVGISSNLTDVDEKLKKYTPLEVEFLYLFIQKEIVY